jgi:hypothetical protein
MVIYMEQTINLIAQIDPDKVKDILSGEHRKTETGIFYVKHK